MMASAEISDSPRQRLARRLAGPNFDVLLAVVVAAATLGVGTALGRSTAALEASTVAAGAAVVAILLARRAPLASFGVLFGVATLSLMTIDLPFGRVRVEQPAILGVFVLLLLQGRLRSFRPIAISASVACFAIYFATMVLSSMLNAPAIMVSARLLIWTGISMLGAVVAFALVWGHNGEEQRALSWVGLLQGLIGLGIAVAFLALGPGGIPGMQVSPGEAPKVASIDFEANLYASLLGLLAPFALEQWRRRRGVTEAIVAGIVIVALGLGVTRGAYAGLAAGLIVYLGLLFVHKVPRGVFVRVAGLAAVACMLAPVTATALLPKERSNSAPTPTGIAVASSSAAPGHSPGASPSPGHSPGPSPSPTPAADTLAWRLDRIPTAISDIQTSPLIGFGAAAFGQRHLRSDAPGVPDYIGMQALVAVYETGILGSLGLALGFLILLLMLALKSGSDVGRYAAYAGAICSFLVSYQATNALWFSINWLIVGAALALVASSVPTRTTPR
jgi:hypothetical protein